MRDILIIINMKVDRYIIIMTTFPTADVAVLTQPENAHIIILCVFEDEPEQNLDNDCNTMPMA